MLNLPKEKKWQIYCSQKGETAIQGFKGGPTSMGMAHRSTSTTNLSNDPVIYIEKVTAISRVSPVQPTQKAPKPSFVA